MAPFRSMIQAHSNCVLFSKNLSRCAQCGAASVPPQAPPGLELTFDRQDAETNLLTYSTVVMPI